ncbi:MAG: EscU/YscU/HrcU family type III secretion system export apparatus switch protein, partial [Planctomycetota bacterium]
SMQAPTVVAKGADLMAKRIIEIAKENGVAVVERKAVARFLYFNVKVGKSIPYELYMAVAEIINFVNRQKRAA